MIDLTAKNYVTSKTFCILKQNDKYLLCRKKQENESILTKQIIRDRYGKAWVYLFSAPEVRMLTDCVGRYYEISDHYAAIEKVRNGGESIDEERPMCFGYH